MKEVTKITAAILVIALVAALICTAIELDNTREQLLEATARIRLLEFENIMKTADNIQMSTELAEAKAGDAWAEVQ